MHANLIMLAVFAISLSLAIVFVVSFRAWRERGKRRSPLQDRQAGHVPGQQLVDRVSDSGDELLLSVIVMYFRLLKARRRPGPIAPQVILRRFP